MSSRKEVPKISLICPNNTLKTGIEVKNITCIPANNNTKEPTNIQNSLEDKDSSFSFTGIFFQLLIKGIMEMKINTNKNNRR